MIHTGNLPKIFLIALAIILVFHPLTVFARDASEIETEKAAKQAELNKLNSELKQAQQKLNSSVYRRNSSLSEIENIKAELTQIEEQQKVNQLQKQQLEQEIEVKKLEKEKREKDQDAQIANSYMSWKTQDESYLILGGVDVLKNAIYLDYVTENSKESILGISGELDELTKSNTKYEEQLTQLSKDSEALAEKKVALEKQIVQMNANIASAKTNVDGLRSRAAGLRQNLDFLSSELRSMFSCETKALQRDPNDGKCVRSELTTGEYYFVTRGRDRFQGHGIGLSQFGAYGAANQGWSAEKILTFYYTGTKVESLGARNVTISNGKSMDINTYVAGLGEIPDKACGNAEQAAQNPGKYVADNPSTIWDCWPEEAIKAQVIAARSYAATNGGPICTDASCQVYKGGNAKQWAADDTVNEYVTYGGKIIRAFYSSDNSQGFGTADVSEVWNNYNGSYSGDFPYLKNVNDMGIAANGGYRDWTCRTNSYTMQEINELFEYGKHACNTDARSFFTNLKNSTGTITSLNFEKGPSQRVRKVHVTGTNGTATLSGTLFKSLWNDWINTRNPSGQFDYIYSLTWNFQQQ